MAKVTSTPIPEFVSRHISELGSICQRHEVARLELFGSAVTDSFNHETSDLDFLVEFEWTSHPSRWFYIYFDFRDALELLFGRSVDLVSYRTVRNPYLIASINEQRTVLYAA